MCFWNEEVDVVAGPAMGGVILSQWVTYHLGMQTSRRVRGVYAESVGESFVFKRGYDKLIAGKNVLVVEDILTTGGSARKVVETVRALGGTVVGLGALCNRGGVTTKDVGDVPKFVALENVPLDSWSDENCPLCKAGIPINTAVGKGREFLARKGK